ncbi:MAG: hypothetical protein R6X22_07505 [Gemmatimonadota bacterium]
MRAAAPRRSLVAPLAICALITFSHGLARAQEPAPEAAAIAPGSVTTVVIPIPESVPSGRAAGGESEVAFEVELAAGVTLIGPPTGVIGWRADERAVLPVTLRVPPVAPAGDFPAGRVRFLSDGGGSATVSVRLRVAAVREFDLSVTPSALAVEPGGEVRLGFALRGFGNATDSVRVALEAGAGIEARGGESLVVLPGAGVVEGELVARVGGETRPGTELLVRVAASGIASRKSRPVRIVVREPAGAFPSLVRMPASVFVGSTLTSSGADVRSSRVAAITGSGEIARSTELYFSGRIGNPSEGGGTFRDAAAIPRLQLGLRHPDWSAVVGDVESRTSDLLGYVRFGRGAESFLSPGRLFLAATAARPQAPDGRTLEGHVAALEGGWSLGRSRISALASSTERTDLLDRPESRTDAALARFEGQPGPGHLLGVDAGWMRIRDTRTGEEESGPALNVRYSYRDRAGSVDLTARTRPMSAADPRLPAPQFLLSGAGQISSRVTALGAVYENRAPTTSPESVAKTNGGHLGLRVASRPLTAEVTGRLQSRTGPRDGVRGTARGAVWTRAGPVHVDASVEAGSQSLDGLEGKVLEIRVGAAIRGRTTWARASARYADDLLLGPIRIYDAYVSHGLGSGHEAYASASVFDGARGGGATLDLEAGGIISLGRSLRAFLGVERTSRSSLESPRWRLSAGLQQGLGLPIPLRRPSLVEGFVFEDRNADGRHDAGEPLLDGVRLRLGIEEAITRSGGRFAFRQDVGSRIEIDAAYLGEEFLPPRDVLVQRGVAIAIPVVRTAGLRIEIFLDENGNGAWDEAEPPVAGASLALGSIWSSSWRLRTGGDGGVVLDAIRPGSYRIEVDRETLPWRSGPAPEVEVEVRGGERTTVQVPVPIRSLPMATFGEDD